SGRTVGSPGSERRGARETASRATPFANFGGSVRSRGSAGRGVARFFGTVAGRDIGYTCSERGSNFGVRTSRLGLKPYDIAVNVIGAERAASSHPSAHHHSPQNQCYSEFSTRSKHGNSPPGGLAPVPKTQALGTILSSGATLQARIKQGFWLEARSYGQYDFCGALRGRNEPERRQNADSLSVELSKTYDPKAAEERWFQTWIDLGYFKADPQREGPVFSI